MRMLDAARRLGVSTATLKRFLVHDIYLGLLKRTPGGHYRFTEEDVKALDYRMTQRGLGARPEQRMYRRRPRRW